MKKDQTSGSTYDKLYWFGAGSDTLTETNLSGTATADFIFFGGKRTARLDVASGTIHYYFSDHLGSASVVTNATGTTIEEESDYYPWGRERVITDLLPDQNYKFTGKERDLETGLDYFGARYYSSGFGRFLTPDWADAPTAVPYADFGNPQSLNLYAYVGNNPITRFDVDGHCAPFCELVTWAVKRSAADGGPREFAKNVGIGVAKGAGNFVNDNLNLGSAIGNPGAAVATMMTPQPEALRPSNETQAQVLAGTQIALTVGTAAVPAALEASSSKAANLSARAQQIHGALDPIAQEMRTTAVGAAVNADGSSSALVSSSQKTLAPAQRAVLQPGEVAVRGAQGVHAEQKILNAATVNGQTVTSVGVSRTPCPTCTASLQRAGVRVVE